MRALAPPWHWSTQAGVKTNTRLGLTTINVPVSTESIPVAHLRPSTVDSGASADTCLSVVSASPPGHKHRDGLAGPHPCKRSSSQQLSPPCLRTLGVDPEILRSQRGHSSVHSTHRLQQLLLAHVDRAGAGPGLHSLVRAGHTRLAGPHHRISHGLKVMPTCSNRLVRTYLHRCMEPALAIAHDVLSPSRQAQLEGASSFG